MKRGIFLFLPPKSAWYRSYGIDPAAVQTVEPETKQTTKSAHIREVCKVQKTILPWLPEQSIKKKMCREHENLRSSLMPLGAAWNHHKPNWITAGILLDWLLITFFFYSVASVLAENKAML